MYAFGIGPLIHVMIPVVNRFLPGFAKPTPVVDEAAEVPAACRAARDPFAFGPPLAVMVTTPCRLIRQPLRLENVVVLCEKPRTQRRYLLRQGILTSKGVTE